MNFKFCGKCKKQYIVDYAMLIIDEKRKKQISGIRCPKLEMLILK